MRSWKTCVGAAEADGDQQPPARIGQRALRAPHQEQPQDEAAGNVDQQRAIRKRGGDGPWQQSGRQCNGSWRPQWRPERSTGRQARFGVLPKSNVGVISRTRHFSATVKANSIAPFGFLITHSSNSRLPIQASCHRLRTAAARFVLTFSHEHAPGGMDDSRL